MIIDIRKLSRFLDKYSKYLSNEYQITLPQLLCLYEIVKEDGINLTELTKRVNMNNSAVTGIVDRLELKCYVRRVKKAGDRRTIQIEATGAGREFTGNIVEVLGKDCFIDISKFSNENLQDLSTSIQKIISSFDPEIKKIDLV
jgi:DNA-binding MarR family transcriptional regulator